MSPKYAMKDIFSKKSDVYSFGVLLLEFLSGKKNTVFLSSTTLSLIELVSNKDRQIKTGIQFQFSTRAERLIHCIKT